MRLLDPIPAAKLSDRVEELEFEHEDRVMELYDLKEKLKEYAEAKHEKTGQKVLRRGGMELPDPIRVAWLAKLVGDLESEAEKIEPLEQELSDLKRKMKEDVEAKDDEIGQLNKELFNLKKELAAKAKAQMKNTRSLEPVESLAARTSEIKAGMQLQLDAKNEKIQRLTDANKDLKIKLNDHRDNSKARLEARENEIDALQIDIDELQSQNKARFEELEDTKAAVRKYKEEIIDLKERVGRLEHADAKHKVEFDELSDKHALEVHDNALLRQINDILKDHSISREELVGYLGSIKDGQEDVMDGQREMLDGQREALEKLGQMERGLQRKPPGLVHRVVNKVGKKLTNKDESAKEEQT